MGRRNERGGREPGGDDPRRRPRDGAGPNRGVSLGERGSTYTKGEIFRGVDFGNDAPPETVDAVLTEIQDGLVDLAGDVVASGTLVDDLDAALAELVADGTVAEKEIETGNGTTTHYRLNTAESRR